MTVYNLWLDSSTYCTIYNLLLDSFLQYAILGWNLLLTKYNLWLDSVTYNMKSMAGLLLLLYYIQSVAGLLLQYEIYGWTPLLTICNSSIYGWSTLLTIYIQSVVTIYAICDSFYYNLQSDWTPLLLLTILMLKFLCILTFSPFRLVSASQRHSLIGFKSY